MNERIWEGIVQVLRQDEAPLTATARLWRRDDFFGTDWGGQLEIPIALRRALPPGEYTMLLAPGREAVAFIGLGPSNAVLTFPTVTGTSAPPFGTEPGAVTEGGDAAAQMSTADPVNEAEAESHGAGVGDESKLIAFDGAQSHDEGDEVEDAEHRDSEEAPAPISRTGTAPDLAAIDPRHAAPSPADEPRSPHNEEPTMLESGLRQSAEAISLSPSAPPALTWNGWSPEGNVRTEGLARAFLAAVETQQRLQSVNAAGVEGHLFAAARALVAELAGLIESRLRGADESAPWLGQRLAVLDWFGATLTAMPDRPDLVELGESLARLSSVVRNTLTEPQAIAA